MRAAPAMRVRFRQNAAWPYGNKPLAMSFGTSLLRRCRHCTARVAWPVSAPAGAIKYTMPDSRAVRGTCCRAADLGGLDDLVPERLPTLRLAARRCTPVVATSLRERGAGRGWRGGGEGSGAAATQHGAFLAMRGAAARLCLCTSALPVCRRSGSSARLPGPGGWAARVRHCAGFAGARA